VDRDQLSLERTLFCLSAEQSKALLADLNHPQQSRTDQQVIAELLAAPKPWEAGG
jgi:hypothetical protein